jgi:uncharacterized protein
MAINRTTARWLATILLTLAAASVCAELPVPGLTGRVVDVAQLLSSSEKTRIEDRIRGLESATGGQVAVLIIPSLKGDSLEEFSMRVAEAWKIGKKGKDNGALLLISRDDRKIRWEIGYGWEGQVNDARAGDIIRGMGPSFRQGKYAEGIDYAICELQTFITGKRPAGAPAHVQTTRNRRDPGGLFFLIVLGLIFLSSIGGWGRRHFGVGPVIFLGGRGGYRSGGGGGFGGGGFSGGGGSFGGGGASGGW